MDKYKVLVLVFICFSCISISFATSNDTSDTTMASTNHVTKTTDSVTTQNVVKTDNVNSINTALNQNGNSLSKLNEEVKNTKTSVNHTYVRPKSYVLLNASVVDNNNENVNIGQVFFKLNNTVLKDANNSPYLVNVENGFAQLNYYVGLIPTGDYNFTAIYNGTTNYNISSADDTLTVHKNKTIIDVTINPSSVVSGKKMNLTATFTREDNVTVTGGKVAFKLNHITIKDNKGNPIYARLVDGKASIETKIPTGTSANTYIISATYSGTTVNEEARSKNYEFNVTKDDININITQNTYVAERGEKISISGQILNSEYKDTKREHKVILKLNNKTIINNKIFIQQSSILNTFKFTIDTTDLTNEEYNITVIVGENNAYNGKRIETKLFVRHYYDEIIQNLKNVIPLNNKHIVLKLDNTTFEIKDLINKQPSNKTFNGTLVVVENDTLKIKYNDTRNHNVSIDYFTDLCDLSNITLTSRDNLILYVDKDSTGTGIDWCFNETNPQEFDYGNVISVMGDNLLFPVRVVIDNKILKISYGDNKTHNIALSKITWIGSEDYPESLRVTETKLLEFVGNKP